MELKYKLMLKTLGFCLVIDFLWIIMAFCVAYFLNDFVGRSLAGIGVILIPIIISYKIFWNKIIENHVYAYMKEQEKIPKKERNIVKDEE